MPSSQKEIARRTGLAQSTVSMALAGHPEIGRETRERVERIAKEIGYRPDPLLSGLAAYRKSVRPASYQATLAFVTNHRTRDAWRQEPYIHRYFLGACQRADRLGYKMEDFWLGEKGMTPARARQIFLARNITGLLFAPPLRSRTRIPLDMSRFCAVTFGFTLVSPRLHGVGNNNFRTMSTLLRKLRALGYRRPGLCMKQETHERSDHAWLAGFWTEQQRLPAGDHIPWLIEKPVSPESFRRWFKRHRPDCIVSMGLGNRVSGWIRETGCRIPEEVGLAYASLDDPSLPVSGMYENFEEIGSQAVDLVVGMLHRHEYGEPAIPMRVLVEGTWMPGATVRTRTRQAS